MKVIKSHTEPTFQPIEFSIVIESQEEYNLLANLGDSSIDIEEAVRCIAGKDEAQLLEAILNEFYNDASAYWKALQG